MGDGDDLGIQVYLWVQILYVVVFLILFVVAVLIVVLTKKERATLVVTQDSGCTNELEDPVLQFEMESGGKH